MTPFTQSLVIRDWLPAPVLNGSRQKHWATLRKQATADKTMAWASAKQAGWVFVEGKVRLTVTLVFSVRRRRDQDNIFARCKAMIDGLKGLFFQDDDMEHLELVVKAEVEPGRKETRLLLESLDELTVASGSLNQVTSEYLNKTRDRDVVTVRPRGFKGVYP